MNLEERLEKFLGTPPTVADDVYIAASAVVIGDVTLGPQSSVWHQATLRGDLERIVVGRGTNIQDSAVIHLADDLPCEIGDWVTVGHRAILHACRIGDESLIGMGATVLDGAQVGAQCLIGEHALVTGGTKIPPGSLVLGSPAKVVRALNQEERARLKPWADKYVTNAAFHLRHHIELGRPKTWARA